MTWNLGATAAQAGLDPSAASAIAVTSVTEDSRRVAPGALFCAVGGGKRDGHDFAEEVRERGAAAICGDRPGLTVLAGLPYLYAPQPRKALGVIAHALAGDPTAAMRVVGVTGTNGKSSTVVLTAHVLNASGRKTAAFGTLGYSIGEETFAADHTTPFGEELARLFAEARKAGCDYGAMEASSHAIAQERIAGVRYRAAAFTNLTQDHLDFHASMEEYCEAKLGLFRRVEGEGSFCVVNVEDPWSGRFIDAAPGTVFTFGDGGDCRAADIRMEGSRAAFIAHTPWGASEVRVPLLGRHNVMNALGVIAICGGFGLSLVDIAAGLESAPRVAGRFEPVDCGQPFHVIVDYAHTDDGLRNVLTAARSICSGRVITVFGCGGDRDKTKRPKMARASAELSDYCIVTSDNPRTEDPLAILADIERGMIDAGKTRVRDFDVIADRREAIVRAIGLARPGDLVMIAGKGHEDYQILGTEKIHFDDREEARKALEALR